MAKQGTQENPPNQLHWALAGVTLPQRLQNLIARGATALEHRPAGKLAQLVCSSLSKRIHAGMLGAISDAPLPKTQLGLGVDDIIFRSMMGVLLKGGEVAFPNETFGMYKGTAEPIGLGWRAVDKDFCGSGTAEGVKATIADLAQDGVTDLYLVSPMNPSGELLDPALIVAAIEEAAAQSAKSGAAKFTVHLDAVYSDHSKEGLVPLWAALKGSTIDNIELLSHLRVFVSPGKPNSTPGYRVGAEHRWDDSSEPAAANPTELPPELSLAMINQILQQDRTRPGEDQTFLHARTVARDLLEALHKALDMDVFPSQAAFVSISFTGPKAAELFCDGLAKQGFKVRQKGSVVRVDLRTTPKSWAELRAAILAVASAMDADVTALQDKTEGPWPKRQWHFGKTLAALLQTIGANRGITIPDLPTLLAALRSDPNYIDYFSGNAQIQKMASAELEPPGGAVVTCHGGISPALADSLCRAPDVESITQRKLFLVAPSREILAGVARGYRPGDTIDNKKGLDEALNNAKSGDIVIVPIEALGLDRSPVPFERFYRAAEEKKIRVMVGAEETAPKDLREMYGVLSRSEQLPEYLDLVWTPPGSTNFGGAVRISSRYIDTIQPYQFPSSAYTGWEALLRSNGLN